MMGQVEGRCFHSGFHIHFACGDIKLYLSLSFSFMQLIFRRFILLFGIAYLSLSATDDQKVIDQTLIIVIIIHNRYFALAISPASLAATKLNCNYQRP